MTETTARRRTNADEPAIWLGCLHCYNSGRLVGHWFAASGADEVTLADVHRGSRVDFASEGCEEIWGLDVENIAVHREMDAIEAAQWGALYDEVDDADEWQAISAWVRSGDYIAEGDSDIPCLSDFRERYCGTWDSMEDYAYSYVEDMGLFEGIPDDSPLVTYFDHSAFARDLRLSGEYSTTPNPDGGVYIFRCF
ncbi:antirestriction protein ArdA [Gordonia amarae]|uniref:Antirestriction ArdA family protein n=2 Tax=Gordonia amarae TaxID=36821 RepID=G7GLU4_9ACTN|nr:antirestriction protein ArdA [Gordonia amarae]MCS3876500.1 antirestriction protein [Gordonia amarae]QHN19408.1 antirestriction protein ArdA [Gordonia amarae]QHN23884.1 antirestriction protein ArdA [Gordonia amarae]QHN32794.1 antirestriction protein ArdA [Gordonia amarae]QHN41513.1 antirestriction protein ArdA [Gordonia amarae]